MHEYCLGFGGGECFENTNNHQKEKMAFSLLGITSFLYFVFINTVDQRV